MRLFCLGTTGFHPSPSRHTACYYLPEQSVVLDAGTGIFRLVEHLLREPKKSLNIFLSHAHLDHVVGLTFLLDALAVTELEEVTLIGEAAKLDAVKDHLYHELLFPVPPSFKFRPLEGSSGELNLDSMRVEWFPLEHPGGSLGYVFSIPSDDGIRKFSYITDTISRREAAYLPKIEKSDLLLHECYFGDEQQELAITTGHSWISEVREIVRLTQPRQTVLIHINPLAEILGSGFELTDDDRNLLCMQIAEDSLEVQF